VGPDDMALVRRRGHATQEGDQFVMEWTFELVNPSPPPGSVGGNTGDPSAFLASLGPLPTVHEVYDNQGQRISSNFDEVYGPFMESYEQQFSAYLEQRLAELNAQNIRDHRPAVPGMAFDPPRLTPKRVLADPVLQTFKLDFNQFLRPEENLRLLLRTDPSP